MTKEYRFLSKDSEVRASTNGDGDFTQLSGYALVFNSPSEQFSSKQNGDYYEIIPDDANIVFDDVYSYWNHDNNYTIASVRSNSLKVQRDKKGVSFLINDLTRVSEIPTAKETLRVGDARMSFGMTDIVAHFETKNGVRYRVITSMTLFEVSPVPNPAYSATSAELRDLDEASNGSFDPTDLISDEIEIQDEADYANAVSDPEDMPSDVENIPAFNLVTYAQMLKVQLDIDSVLMGYSNK